MSLETKSTARVRVNGPASKGAPPRPVSTITAPTFAIFRCTIAGVDGAPLVINNFNSKAREEMRLVQEAGQKGQKGAARKPKDFQSNYDMQRATSHLKVGMASPLGPSAMR